MRNVDKQKKINELALAVFKRYHGNEPGGGGWALEHDQKQLKQYITPLVEMWVRRMRGMDVIGIDYGNAMDCARGIGIHDRTYVNEVRFAYNDVCKARADEREIKTDS